MSNNRLSNLGKDLLKAKQQALLIEVLQSDLDSWVDQSPNPFRLVCDASSAVYDVCVKDGKTNVLVVGEAEGQGPLSIFGCLLGSLDNEFDDLHKREILKKLAGFGLNQALGGVVSEAVGDSLSFGAGQVMEYLAELNGSAPDFLTSAVEVGVESVADESGEIVGDIGGTGAEAIAGQFSSEDSIYLSRAARKRLKELAPRLSDEATSHETLQLALEMLLVTGLGAPKVIVVDDPFRLDDASLALLAMLVSLEKDLRQVASPDDSETGREQTAGISVVLTFTNSQLNDTVENKGMADKQQAISRLRMMASRYSLLERLDSDFPVPAVRASTFVGRNQELESLWLHWNSLCEQPDTDPKQTWCLIKGEPGTGKTALANQFIDQLRSDTSYSARLSIPTLRMLNQTGHSAQATGLASLKNSMADELRRLTFVYREKVGWLTRSGHQITEGVQSWKDDATSDDPEAKRRMQGRVGKMVSKLLGVDAVMGIAGSVKGWSKQDEMRSMREEEFGQSSRANHKEEQFELLREALWEIRKLSEKCTRDQTNKLADNAPPFLLLIDDVQWIDDFTAEFLLDEWPADLPVYIVATARGSDSFTTTAESSTRQSLNHHRNRLFSELGLIDPASVGMERESGAEQKKEGQQKRKISLASYLELKGMDQPMLANLIKLTYTGIMQEQAEQFAVGIIKNLSGANDAPNVVTLFAIETLNVISDEQFYLRNPELPRLIRPLRNFDGYSFEEPKNVGLSKALEKVFKSLANTYEESYLFEIRNKAENLRFNLASYAILEERLHLIESYFGGAARYFLLVSGLLNSPFQADLIQYILKDISNLKSDKYPELLFFIKDCETKCNQDHRFQDYEVLEHAYEIIRRLNDDVIGMEKYVHQHDLIRQFLIGQLDKILKTFIPDSAAFELGLKHFVNIVTHSGTSWFNTISKNNIGRVLGEDRLDIEHKRFLVAVYGFWHRLMESEGQLSGLSAKVYSKTLSELAILLDRVGRFEEALSCYEETLSIRRAGYEAEPEIWGKVYVGSLLNLSSAKYSEGNLNQAIELTNLALGIARSSYENAPHSWDYIYASALNSGAVVLMASNEAESARPLLEKALEIGRSGYKSKPDFWANICSQTLHNMAWALGRESMESVQILREAIQIQEILYRKDPDREAESYATSLADLGAVLTSIGQEKDAMPYLMDALLVSELGYKTAPDRWRACYSTTLSKAAIGFEGLGEADKVLPLYEQAVLVDGSGYRNAPERWAYDYSLSLKNLALALSSIGKKSEAIERFREALSISRPRYLEAPERWGGLMFSCLRGLARACPIPSKEAYSSYKEVLDITSVFLRVMPEDWAKKHVEALNDFGLYLNSCGRGEDALTWLAEAFEISSKRYVISPEDWRECYFIALHTIGNAYQILGGAASFHIDAYRRALEISSSGYRKDRKVWTRHYIASLNSLAAAFFSDDEPKLALPLLEKATSICRERYEIDSVRWEESFSSLLKNLAESQEKAVNIEEALPTYKEALLISEAGYQRDEGQWSQIYAADLSNLAIAQEALGELDQALGNHEAALSIRRTGYDAQPERWRQDLVHSIGHVGAFYFKIGESNGALEMFRVAVALCWEGYQADPRRWTDDFFVSLKNLAASLESSDPEQARQLHARASSLRSSTIDSERS